MLKKEAITFTYEMTIDSDTGDVIDVKLIDAAPAVNENEPLLFLEKNKFRLNNTAMSYMKLTDSSRLVINYATINDRVIPVIGTPKAFGISGGNKVSKRNTVACRGIAHDTLKKYGTEFAIVKYNGELFQLVSKDTTVTDKQKEAESVFSNLNFCNNEDKYDIDQNFFNF